MHPDESKEMRERLQQQIDIYRSGLLRYISLYGVSTTGTDKGDKETNHQARDK